MSQQLASTPWTAIPERSLLLVPLGSTEQHGPHLPFTVDADTAAEVARVAGRELGAIVAPVLAYGASGEHDAFPGTLSIGSDALHLVLVELVRSAGWASRVAFINGHGGNLDAVVSAVTQLRREKHDVAWVPCATPNMDLHAGRAETSVMLELRPEAVGAERPIGPTDPAATLLPQLRAQGVRRVSETGVLGDARGASAEEGRDILSEMIDMTCVRLRAWNPGPSGLLLDRP